MDKHPKPNYPTTVILTNHHAHSTFSDGKAPAETFLQRAIALGMATYGFSDHAPVPIHDFGNMETDRLGKYVTETDRLRSKYADRIEVMRSLEVDYIPGYINVNSAHIQAADLDYTIGAVHYVEQLDDQPWSFQRAEPSFSRGIDEIFGGSARKMVERYFELVREMVDQHPPDVVAHLDRVKKRNAKGRFWDEHADWFTHQIDLTLDRIAAAGCIMEVNTRGLYRSEIQETYPSRWIVAKAHERGIRLQVNSDAHEVEHITGGFDFAYRALRDMGVEEVTIFRGEAWGELGISDW